MESEVVNALVTVKAFYQDAFDQLFQYMLAMFALVGVVVPLVAGWLNARNLKSEKESLERSIREQVSNAEQKIKHDSKDAIDAQIAKESERLTELLNEKSKDLERQINTSYARLEGSAFHLQANQQSKEGFHAEAAGDFAYAAAQYLVGKDEANAGIALRLTIESLQKATRNEIEDSDSEEKVNDLVKVLEKSNENGRYRICIEDIRAELKKAKQRTAQ